MLNRLEQKVAEFIRRHGLLAEAARILLAVSGGADSIALLHLLHSLKAKGGIDAEIICAHINHQMRGPASDEDERFVVDQAGRLGLSVVTRAVDVRAYARTHGLSIETAGRQLRLANLAEIARDQRCTWVGTGHQKNDNAETVIQRLRRGTGLRGLAGIWPVRRFDDLQLASPLLCTTRHEIVQYLQERDLRWREDHTNADIAYTRNYIRHRLVPFLQQEAQGCLVEELCELATSMKRLCDHVEREAEDAWSRFAGSADGDCLIRASGLASLPEPVAVELIREAVASLGCGQRDVTRAHYQSILQLAGASGGGKKVSLPNGLAVRREGEQVILSNARSAKARRVELAPPNCPAEEPAPMALQVPGTTQFGRYEIEGRVLPRDEVEAVRMGRDTSRFREYLDFDHVQPPIVVRTRRPGDRFQPLGMTGEKKIGKFLTAAKVPRDLRERILILADRERILWVCPIRISEQAKITERTQRVLQLTIVGEIRNHRRR
jgi:tRNA(Ile)-lysidine synthase